MQGEERAVGKVRTIDVGERRATEVGKVGRVDSCKKYA